MSSRIITVSVTADASVESPAELAIIRFTRDNLFDIPTNKQTWMGEEMSKQVITAGADEFRTNPHSGRVSIVISNLTVLGSVVACLRGAGAPDKPSTSFIVSEDTRALMGAAALSEAVVQARADIEPTVRLLGGDTVRVVNVETLKVKAEAGTWPNISARELPTTVTVRARVTFEIEGEGSLELDEDTRAFYDAVPDDSDVDLSDPFGGEDFGVVVPTASETGEPLARTAVGYTQALAPLLDPRSVPLDGRVPVGSGTAGF